MSGNIDLTQALADAEARRQAAAAAEEDARKTQRSDLVGDLLYDIQTVSNDAALDHDAKVARLRAASAGINGQGVAGAVAQPAPAAASVPFDYASLPEEARQIIDMVAAEPGRFKIEDTGAVKDKSYTRLRREHEAAQAAAAGDEDDSSTSAQPPAKKASAPAPAKKTAAPAKKAASQPSEEEPADEASGKPGAWGRIVSKAKEAAANAKQ